jgi:DNA polymerase-3 subunit delta'
LARHLRRLPPSLLFVGPDGSGKAEHARMLFQALHCVAPDANLAPCDHCGPCTRISAGNHPDFLTLAAREKFIAVDDLREMQSTLFFKPIEGKLRFIVIPEAEKLNASSSNALLKALEEPPAHTRFILCARSRARLLPTLLSRCLVVRFPPRPSARNAGALSPWVETLLEENSTRSDMVMSEEGLAFLQATLKILEGAPAYPQLVIQADGLAQGEEWKLELFLDVALLWARRQAVDAAPTNAAAAWLACQRALKLAKLRSLLERQPNRKLLSLVAVGTSL